MTVTVHAAKTNLSKLIERARAGEEIIIAKGKKQVARLVPIVSEPEGRQPGTLKGRVKVGKEFFKPLPKEELAAWEGK